MRVLFIFALLSNLMFAQADEADEQSMLRKNSISLSFGSAILINGLGMNYQRVIPKTGYYYSLSAGANFFQIDFFRTETHSVIFISNGIITGLDQRNHFEANIGLGWDQVNKSSSSGFYGGGGSSASQYSQFIPVGNIGYRFQAPNKDFVFRTGIGLPELLYVSFGFSF